MIGDDLLADDHVDSSPAAVTLATETTEATGESSAETWYVHAGNGEQYGPADSPTFQTWIAEGRITPDCLVWKDGWPEWQEASTILNQTEEASSVAPPAVGLDASSERFFLPNENTQSLAPQTLPKGTLPQGYAAYQKRKTSNF
ncbi:MAG: DUF4339 domain-containing protein, partial [Planctomycetota bacterium]